MTNTIPEISLIQVKLDKETEQGSVFVIEPLLPGFGLTLGNALRRVLLSSLPGAAITSIRIDGISHEFSTIKGAREDVVDIILNLKQVRFKFESEEPQIIVLDAKGEKTVKAGDFKCPTGVSVVNKNQAIVNLAKDGRILLEATVERGRGYISTEQRKDEKLPIGVIAIDAAFSPIRRVNFELTNTRVGKMTNFDRLILTIETDGTILPQAALEQAAQILVDHFSILSGSSDGQANQRVNELGATDGEVAEPASGKEVKAKKVITKPVNKNVNKKVSGKRK